MFTRRGSATFILAGLLVLNAYLLRSSAGSMICGVSFALACLSLSWVLTLANEGDKPPQTVAPKPLVMEASSVVPRKQVSSSPLLNAFTIDLEDYFHTEVSSRAIDYSDWEKMPSRIESSVHRLLDLLDDYDTRTTVFVLGWVAKKNPALIREIAQRGHEIGCHSFRHRKVNQLKPAAFREDTRIAKEIIEDVTGAQVEGYRAPSFSITPGTEWAFNILQELGFCYDSSVHPIWHAAYANMHAPRFPYHIDGTNFLEIPITTWRWGGANLPIGGGAYMRLLPYRYVRHGLSVVNEREWQPVTVYVHPWEIDYLQPAIHARWAEHVRQNWGTRTMERKIRLLLSSMRFGPIVEAYERTFSASRPVLTGRAQRAATLAQVS